MFNALRRRLVAQLGEEQVAREIRWMKQTDAGKNSSELQSMLNRRAEGEPLQYILGSQPFGTLDILTRAPVLIPRHETEEWVIRLSNLISPQPTNPITLIDLGTGTGCIPLLLCDLWPKGSVRAYGVDISPDAVDLAAENARRSGIVSQPSQTHNSFSSHLLDYTSSAFLSQVKHHGPLNVLTSNPPYISAPDYDGLPAEVKMHEDRRALHGGTDGLDFYRVIGRLLGTPGFLSTDAVVALEIGHDQGTSVADIVEKALRPRELEIWKDVWGKDRTVVARTK